MNRKNKDRYITMRSSFHESSSYLVDKEFGKGAPFWWPGYLHEADRLLCCCCQCESSVECLDREEFIGNDEDMDIPDEDGEERFKAARDWPLPYLVASAMYRVLAEKDHEAQERALASGGSRGISSDMWGKLFFVILCFGAPIPAMLQRNGWLEANREAIRIGFKCTLEAATLILDLNFYEIEWATEQGNPCFKAPLAGYEATPETGLQCLTIAGVEEGVAKAVMEEVFETHSFVPFRNALLLEHPSTGTDCAPNPQPPF